MKRIILTFTLISYFFGNDIEVIGEWKGSNLILASKVVMYKTNNHVFIKDIYDNGKSNEKKCIITQEDNGFRIKYIDKNSRDYNLIDKDSNLEYWDDWGYFTEIKPIFFDKLKIDNLKSSILETKKEELKSILSSKSKLHLKNLKTLYDELLVFKDKREFSIVGFNPKFDYYVWLSRLEVLQESTLEDMELLNKYSFLSGDLKMLGLEYIGSKGNETEYTKNIRRLIDKAIKIEL